MKQILFFLILLSALANGQHREVNTFEVMQYGWTKNPKSDTLHVPVGTKVIEVDGQYFNIERNVDIKPSGGGLQLWQKIRTAPGTSFDRPAVMDSLSYPFGKTITSDCDGCIIKNAEINIPHTDTGIIVGRGSLVHLVKPQTRKTDTVIKIKGPGIKNSDILFVNSDSVQHRLTSMSWYFDSSKIVAYYQSFLDDSITLKWNFDRPSIDSNGHYRIMFIAMDHGKAVSGLNTDDFNGPFSHDKLMVLIKATWYMGYLNGKGYYTSPKKDRLLGPDKAWAFDSTAMSDALK